MCNQILPEFANFLSQWRSSGNQKAVFSVFCYGFCCRVRNAPSTAFLLLSHISPFALQEVVRSMENTPSAPLLHWTYFILFFALWVVVIAEVQNLCRKKRCLKSFRQKISMLTRTVVQSVWTPNLALLNKKNLKIPLVIFCVVPTGLH